MHGVHRVHVLGDKEATQARTYSGEGDLSVYQKFLVNHIGGAVYSQRRVEGVHENDWFTRE